MFREYLIALVIVTCVCPCFAGIGDLPKEPVEIGATPQFFVDDYIVDNRFAIKYKTNAMVRRFHQPTKHEANPVLADQGSYVNVVRDNDTGLFRMWYAVHDWTEKLAGGKTRYAVAYAESKDGLSWRRPTLGLYKFKGTTENNVVWQGVNQVRASGPQILLTIPEDQRRGYR